MKLNIGEFRRIPLRIALLALVSGLVATLLVVGAGWGFLGTSGPSAGAATSAELRMVDIRVERIACRLCAARITDAVQSLTGVRDVRVSVQEGAVQVAYVPTKISAERIASTIDELGYPASLPSAARELSSTREYPSTHKQ